MSKDLKRMWINCPSTHYEAHKFHGRRVLMDPTSKFIASERVILAGTELVEVWFLSGDQQLAVVRTLDLSPGWPEGTTP